MSNLTLNVDTPTSPPAYAPPAVDPFGTGCDNSAEIWAASQAAPIRRAIINGSVVFQDYCATNNFASGGFIADSQVSGSLNFFGNQQYLTRDSSIGGVNGALWNMVYSGVEGAPAASFSGQGSQNTVLAASPVTEEQPFLYTDASGKYSVFVPAVQTNSSGTSWASGSEAGSRQVAVVVLRREPGHVRRGDRHRAGGREEPPADAGRLQPVRADRRSPGRARWCSVSASPRSYRSMATPP